MGRLRGRLRVEKGRQSSRMRESKEKGVDMQIQWICETSMNPWSTLLSYCKPNISMSGTTLQAEPHVEALSSKSASSATAYTPME